LPSTFESDRRDEVLDRLLALVEILRRLLLQLLELGLREIEERPVARRERVGGERLHRRLEGRARIGGTQGEPGDCSAEEETDEDADDHRADER